MAAGSFYKTKEWHKARAVRLKIDGHRCVVPGCPSAATVVDHVVELSSGGLPYDPRNLRSLCPSHHNQAHREKPHGGARNARFVVKGCGPDGWPLDPGR